MIEPATKRGGGRLRVAILGAGLMGRWHLDAARQLGVRVVAIIDPDLDRAAALAACCAGAVPGTDPDVAIDRRMVDLVHICSPSDTHQPLALRAIEAGCHALVEKPIARNASETGDLLRAAGHAGVLLCPVHQYPFQDGVVQAAAALTRLGPVCRISFDICSAGSDTLLAGSRDGVVADILPHPLSLLRHLWPDATLEAAAWHVHRLGDGELLVSGSHVGAALSIGVSMRARPTRFDLTVQCQGGSLRLNLFHGYCAEAAGRISRLRKATQPFAEAAGIAAAAAANLARRALRQEPAYPGLRPLVRRFYQAAIAGTALPIPASDILAVAAARDVLLRRMQPQPTAPACLPAVPLPALHG